jgi:predicted nucleotidyltransferase
MSLPIAVSDKEWRIVQDILASIVPHREVWAFGSRAKFTSKPFSDLDLVVIGQQPLSLAELAELSDVFSNSDLPYKVDVVNWATTSEPFRKIIEERHVLVKPAYFPALPRAFSSRQ